MENFQNNSPKHQRKGRQSFDGMLGGRPVRPAVNSSNRFKPHRISAGDKGQGGVKSVDNFKRGNGFHATPQPGARRPAARTTGRNPQRDARGVIDLTLPASGAKSKHHLSRRKKIKRTVATFAVIIILIVGFLFAKGYIKLHSIFKGGGGAAALQDNVDPSKLKGEGDGRVNILLLGRGGDGHDGADLTDTILVASIDPVQKKAAILSIPRDLYTPTASNTKINAVFADAKNEALANGSSRSDAENIGFSAIEKQVTRDMGIPIHYHLMVDFKAFEQAINTVGGVDINVDKDGAVYERLWDETTRQNYTLNVQEGQQHFDGQRALFYARSRHTSSRGDFDRAERQRKLILALKDKVLSLGTFSNPVKVSQLIDAFGNHISANMSLSEVMRLYEIGKGIDSNSVVSIGLADPPNEFVTTGMINGQSIVRPKAGLTDYTDIQNYVRNALRDGFLAKENATVAVYNGTETPGLATKKATELKSFGYTVGTVDNAPTSNYTKTIIVDRTNGQKKYTKHYLETRFGVSATTTMPDSTINPNNADFVIILGQDANSGG
ncbi:MAG: LCP family protein [Candidatus Saccharimonadales bacterium]